ncbi:uncharacterized protein ATC70_001513 [Mucor velutinosus]|uniref:PH domain-containing protein n=1 Tax=Mucor velutinosus TaxID=708070 RepID=A0AAN7DIM6_9FUNG|nr:hypothetical protein ATC70_001513 [Mucor velutinosus]
MATIDTDIPMPQHDTNTYQNKVIPMTEKTEQPAPQQQQQPSLMTPPISPINTSANKGSLKITAGQTGLPWLTRDADAEGFSPTAMQQSPQEMSATPTSAQGSIHSTASPPPKFMARPRTASVIRFPTRKRTMQKHIYTMKDGLDPVKVLCNRLTSWQVSVKYLLSMFHSIKKVESSTGKGYRKIDSKSTIPVKIKDQFKSSHGVQDAWAAFRQYTRENSLIHQDFVDFIENEIVPILHIILKDIHAMMQSLKHNKDLRTNTLWECRKKADKVITQLNSDIYSVVNAQEKAKSNYVIPKGRDPLLSKYVVIHTIRDLYKQENRLHKDFLETQDSYRRFEQEKIINVYTELFQTFERYRVQHHLENLEGVTKVAGIFNAIETDAEWLDFVQHHDNELVKSNAAFKDEQALDFPNASHPLVQPLAIGVLQRHHGKKWHEEYYVLSPVGLLHRFKSEQDLLNTPLKPEATMFVPQCTILINPPSQLLELKGKVLGSLFGSKKLVELSSSDFAFIKHWIDRMGPMALQQETAVINTPLPPQQQPQQQQDAVVADNRSIQSKVQAEDEPESSNLGGVTQVGAVADATMQSIDQGGTSNAFQPITNVTASDRHHNNSNLSHHYDDQDDSDHDFARQTVEYSTHSPAAAAAAAEVSDTNNPFHTMSTTASSSDPAMTNTGPSTPIETMTPAQQKHGDVHTSLASDIKNTNTAATTTPSRIPGVGPTREGSDIFWDTSA